MKTNTAWSVPTWLLPLLLLAAAAWATASLSSATASIDSTPSVPPRATEKAGSGSLYPAPNVDPSAPPEPLPPTF